MWIVLVVAGLVSVHGAPCVPSPWGKCVDYVTCAKGFECHDFRTSTTITSECCPTKSQNGSACSSQCTCASEFTCQNATGQSITEACSANPAIAKKSLFHCCPNSKQYGTYCSPKCPCRDTVITECSSKTSAGVCSCKSNMNFRCSKDCPCSKVATSKLVCDLTAQKCKVPFGEVNCEKSKYGCTEGLTCVASVASKPYSKYCCPTPKKVTVGGKTVMRSGTFETKCGTTCPCAKLGLTGSSLYCSNGVCCYDGYTGSKCSTKCPCSKGWECKSGTCQIKLKGNGEGPCQQTKECQTGLTCTTLHTDNKKYCCKTTTCQVKLKSFGEGPCSQTKDCKSGLACKLHTGKKFCCLASAGTSGQQCSTACPCATGLNCRSGRCCAGSGDYGHACSSTCPCQSKWTCSNGKCAIPTKGYGQGDCDQDKECVSGLVCISRTPGKAIRSYGDDICCPASKMGSKCDSLCYCRGGMTCTSGQCCPPGNFGDSCSSTCKCKSGHQCKSGICSLATGGSCTLSSQCVTGAVCYQETTDVTKCCSSGDFKAKLDKPCGGTCKCVKGHCRNGHCCSTSAAGSRLEACSANCPCRVGLNCVSSKCIRGTVENGLDMFVAEKDGVKHYFYPGAVYDDSPSAYGWNQCSKIISLNGCFAGYLTPASLAGRTWNFIIYNNADKAMNWFKFRQSVPDTIYSHRALVYMTFKVKNCELQFRHIEMGDQVLWSSHLEGLLDLKSKTASGTGCFFIINDVGVPEVQDFKGTTIWKPKPRCSDITKAACPENYAERSKLSCW